MGKNLISQLRDAVERREETQGEWSLELLEEVVDEVIDEFMRDGLITDDANIQTIKLDVINRVKNDQRDV